MFKAYLGNIYMFSVFCIVFSMDLRTELKLYYYYIIIIIILLLLLYYYTYTDKDTHRSNYNLPQPAV